MTETSKKPPINTNFDKIPDKLKKEKKWINWEYGQWSEIKKKFDKKPCGRFIDYYNNQDLWLSFEDARDNCILSDGREGMGYILLGSGYIFVDIDGITNKESMELNEIDQAISSYTEISINKNGYHIIFEAPAVDFPRNVIHAPG